MFVTPLVSTWLEQGLIVPTLVPKTKTLMSTNFEFLTSASPFECYPQSLDNTQNKQTQGLWSKFLVYHSNSTSPIAIALNLISTNSPEALFVIQEVFSDAQQLLHLLGLSMAFKECSEDLPYFAACDVNFIVGSSILNSKCWSRLRLRPKMAASNCWSKWASSTFPKQGQLRISCVTNLLEGVFTPSHDLKRNSSPKFAVFYGTLVNTPDSLCCSNLR